jgi:hypothetical protein
MNNRGLHCVGLILNEKLQTFTPGNENVMKTHGNKPERKKESLCIRYFCDFALSPCAQDLDNIPPG